MKKMLIAFMFTGLVACGDSSTSLDVYQEPPIPPVVVPPPDDPIPPPVPPPVECGTGLAAVDLAGVCRKSPATPGALEAVE